MMGRTKETYPAIKSIVWFNTNKELDWALNLEGNTGLAAYNNAVSDSYFAGTLDVSIPTDTASEEGKPQVVGLAKLAKEAKGIRKMNKKAFQHSYRQSEKPQRVF